jgi:hypothetical protein
MVRGIALFFFLWSTTVSIEGVAHAQQTQPVQPVQTAPSNPPAVAVHIVDSANNALAITTIEPRLDWPLVLQRSDTVNETNTVQIDVTHLMSVSGRPQPVTLQSKDGGAHDGKVTLAANGQETLRLVAEVPEEGPYKGEIGIVVGGKRTPITLNVTRSVREVVVVGATGNALQVTTPDPAFAWPLVVRRNDNAGGSRNVAVEFANLIAPSGKPVPLELRNGSTPVASTIPITTSISLEPLGQATLTLIGTLTEEGLYNGEIGLVVDGKRFSTALKITRTLKDSAVRIEDITQVQTTTDSAGVDMHLRLQEAEGQETTVDVPTLVKLDRKEGNGQVQAIYEKFEVFVAGNPLSGILVLDPRKTLDLPLRIKGLTAPGNYAGVLRVSSSARKPADKAFELSLRRGMCWAIVLILSGVILSAVARGFYTFGRSAIVAQGDAIAVRDDLVRFQAVNPNLTTDEQRVLSDLLLRLEAVRRGNADPRWGRPDAQVAEIRRKVEVFFRWIDLRRHLGAVRPEWIGDAVRAKHRGIMQILDQGGASETVTNQALANLQTYESELESAVKEELKAAIKALQDEINSLPDGQKIALRDTSAQLTVALRQADGASPDTASATLTAARHAYVQVAIKGLNDSLDPARPASGFTKQTWEDLVADYKRRLNSILAEPDGEEQVREWNKLRTEWMRAIAEPLLRQVQLDDQQAAATQPPAAPNPAAPDPVTASAEYAKAKAALESIDALLLAKNFPDATKAYATAVAAYGRGLAAMKQSVHLSVAGATQAPAPTNGGEVPDEVIQGAWNAIAFVLGAPATAAQANRRLLLAEGLLFLLMVALALVIGLKFLYFDNAAWGAPIDLMVAFLWGFGLHQFGGTAFQGVQSIAQQIVGK